ncbi:uncharacterized protein LOC114303750 isoform X2 [Camellia sinensis]|uniref:uncharacterized protein LOC114303750 isoform X2 n=1 Tax=Camellia sinensis TaxID=4442 RepID=UPI00103696B1|nr:uncharacterized protein LOC114303750 isoform X2 [Camellia sinensis]
MNDDESANMQTEIHKDIASIVVSIVPLFMLLWTIYTGSKFATKPNTHGRYNCYTFSIGVFTVVLGLTYIIMGLAIVADLALNLTGRLQREEKKIDIQQAKDRKTICKDIALFIVTVVSILLLVWTICTGFRLATEPRIDGKYNHLAFLIGVVTIAFGSIYFIIGLAIVADLAQNLSHKLKQMDKKKEAVIYSCTHADDNYTV